MVLSGYHPVHRRQDRTSVVTDSDSWDGKDKSCRFSTDTAVVATTKHRRYASPPGVVNEYHQVLRPDGHVQRGETIVPPLRSLRFGMAMVEAQDNCGKTAWLEEESGPSDEHPSCCPTSLSFGERVSASAPACISVYLSSYSST